ncbi:Rha family transcriptional regulator [Pseudomonas sp. Z4-7]
MSSLEIANVTGKRHDNVKRDILAMLKELKVDPLKFEEI